MNLALLTVTALPFVLSPGASFAITISAASTGDRWAAVKVWAGTALGLGLIAAIAGLIDVGRLLAENDTARTAFGLIGGAVLITLGSASLFRAVRPKVASGQERPAGRRLVLVAFLAVITNAKALGLYALVVPTLDSPGTSGLPLFLAFAGVHAGMLLVWLTLVGECVRRIPSVSSSARVRACLMGVAALTLVVLGVRTILGAL